MGIVNLETLQEFLADDSRDMFEGSSAGSYSYGSCPVYVRFVKARIAEQEHTVDALYMQEYSYSNEKKKYNGFSTNNTINFACLVVDKKDFIEPTNAFISRFDLRFKDLPFVKHNPDITAILVEYIRQNIEITDEDIAECKSQKDFDDNIKKEATCEYVLGASDESRLYRSIRWNLRLDSTLEIIDYFAAPTTWAKRYWENLISEHPYEIKKIKDCIIIEKAIEDKIKEFEASPHSEETAFKTLQQAIKDSSTISLLIEINGNQLSVKYQAKCIRYGESILQNAILTCYVSPKGELPCVTQFLSDNLPESNPDRIPIKYIKEVSKGKKLIWTNPSFGF